MQSTYNLSDFLDRRLHREWTSLVLSRGPVLTDTNQIDEVLVADLAAELAKRDPHEVYAELASELEGRAKADAEALRISGPYYVSIRRAADKPIVERFPLVFPEAAATEGAERQTLLATQRELAIRQTEALTDNQRVMLDWARFANSKSGEAEERLREDLLRERDHSSTMARLVVEGTHQQVMAAKEQSEALLQGDARRREMFAQEQQRVAWTALLQQADVLVPALASGWMKHNGAGGENLDVIAEYKLLEEFVQSLTPEQFNLIGAKLPLTVRMGLMQIHNGQIAPALVPQAAAKLFAQIDKKVAYDVYIELDPATPRKEPHPGRADGLDIPCKLCGSSANALCLDPSKQQKLWVGLVSTKANTMAARGDQAVAALKGQ